MQRNNKKGAVPITLVVAIVAILAIGVFYSVNREKGLGSDVSPQPSNAVNSKESLEDADEDWQVYVNSKYDYTLIHPVLFEIDEQTEYSTIFNPKQTDQAALKFTALYVSVIPEGFKNEQGEIYNFFSEEERNKLNSAHIGDSVNLREDQTSDYWTYERLQDMLVNGVNAVVVENDKVWEGPEGLKDRRVLVKGNGKTYMLGTYYQKAEELENFRKFVESFTISD